MTKEEIDTKADELIQCLGIWEIEVHDAHRIAVAMSRKLDTMAVNGETVPNPLAGTGLVGLPGNPFGGIGNV